MLNKILKIFLVGIFLSLLLPKSARAVTDPLSAPNNKFGIHVANEADLQEAAKLVNSEGGDWGYVTLVVRKDERDTKRWQEVFNTMRRLHLIPIIRVATIQKDGGWEKPVDGEIDGWISFFDSLNWVVKNRYIIIGNEPNHAKEWGNELNPEEYAGYFKKFSRKLKEKNEDYFILPAGFDASSPNSDETMDEEAYLRRMLQAEPDLFNHIDGWNSHSYPNPGFSGSPDDIGRGTVRTFEWELSVLSNLGVEKDLPVFITETGWVHNKDNSVLGHSDPDTVGERLIRAYESAWTNENIVAVTPFILSYQESPFDIFSWRKDEGDYYPFYYEVRSLPKVSGKPKQITSGNLINYSVQQVVRSSGRYSGFMFVENTGQSIWERDELDVVDDNDNFLDSRFLFTKLEPGDKGAVVFSGDVGEEEGEFSVSTRLVRNGEVILAPEDHKLSVVKPSDLEDLLQLFKVGVFDKILNFFRVT